MHKWWHDIDWSRLERETRRNLLAMRKLERDMADAGVPVPPKRTLVAMAEHALLGNVQIIKK